jgi:phosphoglycolate phosphatase-like HAD superfamily hydrolase
MNKYLIFDFDGVIGDTQTASYEATAEVDGRSIEDAAAENMRYSSEKPNHTRDHTLTDEELQAGYQWTRDFGKHMLESNFSLFTDFVAEIESLQTEHKAVVSSGSQLYVIPAMAKTNIQPTHILAYENHHSKEEKIETICKDWGVGASDVYYFTDTLADVYELQNMIAKDKLIGVSWGYCGKELLLRELDEAHLLDKPGDIQRLFD